MKLRLFDKILVVVGIIFGVVGFIFAFVAICKADDTVRVYNKDWVRTHNIQKHCNNTWAVYNNDWVKQGYIQTDGHVTRHYNTDWSLQQQTDTPNDLGIVADGD